MNKILQTTATMLIVVLFSGCASNIANKIESETSYKAQIQQALAHEDPEIVYSALRAIVPPKEFRIAHHERLAAYTFFHLPSKFSQENTTYVSLIFNTYTYLNGRDETLQHMTQRGLILAALGRQKHMTTSHIQTTVNNLCLNPQWKYHQSSNVISDNADQTFIAFQASLACQAWVSGNQPAAKQAITKALLTIAKNPAIAPVWADGLYASNAPAEIFARRLSQNNHIEFGGNQ